MRLPLDWVKVDPELQLRDGLDMDRVRAMQEFQAAGGTLPPITTVGADNLLADGHHRLYAAHALGRLDIEADNIAGGKAEAIAIALMLNNSALTLPLKPSSVGKGVRALLAMGWTQARIAEATGVAQSTVHNTAAILKIKANIKSDIHEQLYDSTLLRIAALPTIDQQAEMAAAVVAVGLPEPRVREAVKAVRAGATVADAVAEATPAGRPTPKTISDVARQAYVRLDDFLAATMTVDGRDLDFWQVLDVIAAQHNAVSPPAIGTLVDRLAEISVRADQYATKLRNGVLREVTA